MADNRYLSATEMESAVQLSGKHMADGELRYRMTHTESGVSFSITERPSGKGGWQLAHSHLKNLRETYVIHTGWVILVTIVEEDLVFSFHAAGETFTVASGEPHTLYVDGGTIFGTAKYGPDQPGKDWMPAPELDALVSHLTAEEAKRKAFAEY